MKPETTKKQEDHWSQMMCQHEHNAHKGRFGMAKSCIRSIADSQTTTPTAKEAANAILFLMDDLALQLRTRVNVDGSITENLYTMEHYLKGRQR